MLPLTVIGVVPQVLPLVLLNVTVGPLAQPQPTGFDADIAVHPLAFFTVIV